MAQSLASYLKGIADAIRTKKKTQSNIKASDFVDEILSIGRGTPLEYTADGTLPNLLSNIADAIRLKRGLLTPINAQDFASEILQIVSKIQFSSILGQAMLGYAILGNEELDPDTVPTPVIYTIDTDVISRYNLNLTSTYVNVAENIPATIYSDDIITFTLSPTRVDGKLPNDVYVSGAEYTYDKQTGILVVYAPFTNVNISITGITGYKLYTPILDITSSGALVISNLDASANMYKVYVNGELRHTWFPSAPTSIYLSPADVAYVVAADATGTYIDSEPSNSVTYILGTLTSPDIYLQTDYQLTAPVLSLADDYEVLIHTVANANRYYLYVKDTLVKTVIFDAETPDIILESGYIPYPGAFVHAVAGDASLQYVSSHESAKIQRPYGQLVRPNIQLVDRSIATPMLYMDGNTVVVIGVDNANTYSLEIFDYITEQTRTMSFAATLSAGEEYNSGITLLSNQRVRVYASDSTGVYDTSLRSTWITYVAKLSKPIVIADSVTGLLTVSPVPYADIYHVYINGTSIPLVYGAEPIYLEHRDAIKVKAIDSTGRYLDSDYVEYTYYSSLMQLAQPRIELYDSKAKVYFTINAEHATLISSIPDDVNISTESITLTFSPNAGYNLTDNVSVQGASYSWNATTGNLVLTSLTTNVIITINCVEQLELDPPHIKMYATVTFVNYDGTILSAQDVEYGEVPVYPGNTPTKPTDAAGSYVFDTWVPAISAVSGDMTYTATFTEQTAATYTVVWKNWDGSIIEVDTDVPYGTIPSYDSAIPAREDQLGQTYIFKGWDNELTAVTSNITYTAVFDVKLNTPKIQSVYDNYTITWTNYDGTVLATSTAANGEMPTYTGETPTRSATDKYTYTFARWTPEIVLVRGNAVYEASYTSTINKYSVTWKNYDGTLLASQEVEYGVIPTYDGATPTRSDNTGQTYTFKGWDKEVTAVTSDVTYTADYNVQLRAPEILLTDLAVITDSCEVELVTNSYGISMNGQTVYYADASFIVPEEVMEVSITDSQINGEMIPNEVSFSSSSSGSTISYTIFGPNPNSVVKATITYRCKSDEIEAEAKVTVKPYTGDTGLMHDFANQIVYTASGSLLAPGEVVSASINDSLLDNGYIVSNRVTFSGSTINYHIYGPDPNAQVTATITYRYKVN